MPDEASPEDFTGDLEKGTPQEETSPSGIGGRLKYGVSTVSGAAKGLYTRPRDAVYRAVGAKDPETGEVDEDRRNTLRAFAGVGGLIAGGALADKYSDGELDGNIDGFGGIAGPAPVNRTGTESPVDTTSRPTETDRSQVGGTESSPEDTSAPTERQSPTETTTETETATDTPTETTTKTEQPYSGQIDGSGYELQQIPGPVEGTGYKVTDEILSSYDPDGWEDIIDEEEYRELGTATEWYLKENAVIGINEPEKISRTFPGQEFNYDTGELYQDIREEASQ